jgi:hypothetical protein
VVLFAKHHIRYTAADTDCGLWRITDGGGTNVEAATSSSRRPPGTRDSRKHASAREVAHVIPVLVATLLLTEGCAMGRRGRKRQLDVETEYWQLLKNAVGRKAACGIVGITRKTWYRWRAENGGTPPVRLGETARNSRYSSLLERQRIATLRERCRGSGDLPADRPLPVEVSRGAPPPCASAQPEPLRR